MLSIKSKADPRAAILRRLPQFHQLSDRELDRLARILDEVSLPAGAILTREGLIGDECYLIVDGAADVSIRGSRVARVGPGEFVGEMALVSGGFRSATVRAATPMHVFTMHKRVFAAMLDSSSVTRAVLAQMTDRLRAIECSPATRSACRAAARQERAE